MVNAPVLVLNQNYEPLNVSRVRRAVVLVIRGKAETLESDPGMVHTANDAVPIPSVIRLVYLVKRPRPEKKLTRREVYQRDKYTCQYCGRETGELSLDHVVPRHRGGRHVWENVVSACMRCNNGKAGRTPGEASMRLICQPFAPHASSYYVPYEYIERHNGWQKFVPRQQRNEGD